MTEFIMKLDFRRVFIEYIVLAISALIIFGGAAACLNRDKIVFALEYISAGIKLNMGASAAEEVDEMADISFETDDVSEIVIVDDSNKVLFSTKDNIAVKGGMFILNETEGKDGFLENSDMPNAVYKAVDKSDFILSSLLPIDLTDISENYRDEFFYEPDFLDKELYLISYMGNGDGKSKIYIINTAAKISEGASYCKNRGCGSCVCVYDILAHYGSLGVSKCGEVEAFSSSLGNSRAFYKCYRRDRLRALQAFKLCVSVLRGGAG